MHQSAIDHMALCCRTYLRKDRHYDIVDVGSCAGAEGGWTHRDQLGDYDCTYTGVDVRPGPNVDLVMTKPYRIPLKSNCADLVITGQTFEHVPFFWVSFLEMCRLVKPLGLVFITVPSRGHAHYDVDLWRFYPDAMRSLAAISRMNLKEAHTDWPPRRPGSNRFDYKAINERCAYWGDTVGVFQKPRRYSKLVVIAREVDVWWANRVGGVKHVKRPKPLEARSRVSSP